MLRGLGLSESVKTAIAASPDDNTMLAEELRSENPRVEVVSAFLSSAPSRATLPNEHGSLPLHIACTNIHVISSEIVQLLVACHTDAAKTPNKFGLLPLHKAVSAPIILPPNLSAIEFLIDSYPRALLASTIEGHVPLHLALSSPKRPARPIVALLLEKEVNAALVQDKHGQLPLHKAAAKTRIDLEIVEMLLAASPRSASIKDDSGNLALHWAASKDSPNSAAILTLIEANRRGLLERDYEGNRPVDKLIVRKAGNEQVEKAMLDHALEVTKTQTTLTKQRTSEALAAEIAEFASSSFSRKGRAAAAATTRAAGKRGGARIGGYTGGKPRSSGRSAIEIGTRGHSRGSSSGGGGAAADTSPHKLV